MDEDEEEFDNLSPKSLEKCYIEINSEKTEEISVSECQEPFLLYKKQIHKVVLKGDYEFLRNSYFWRMISLENKNSEELIDFELAAIHLGYTFIESLLFTRTSSHFLQILIDNIEKGEENSSIPFFPFFQDSQGLDKDWKLKDYHLEKIKNLKKPKIKKSKKTS